MIERIRQLLVLPRVRSEMEITARWIQFKSFSGFLTRGGPKIMTPVDAEIHADRAVYLAARIEAGAWGTVQSYDGCGMSGGLLHNISVSPKDLSQGTFFALLHDISIQAPTEFLPVWDEFNKLGWILAQDGKLRFTQTGKLVPGKAIRLALSGSESGAVPRRGQASVSAEKWALRFATLLSSPGTFAAQSNYAAKWLAEGNSADEISIYNAFLPKPKKIDSIIRLPILDLPPEVELAMCVYHAFSVNAPGTARGCLAPMLKVKDPMTFSRGLIRALGKKNYGNWMDAPGDGSNRYDKTRKVVWECSDIWDKNLARELMPRDL